MPTIHYLDSCTLSISSYLIVLSFILIASRKMFQLGTNDFKKSVQHLVIYERKKVHQEKGSVKTEEVKGDVGVTPGSDFVKYLKLNYCT